MATEFPPFQTPSIFSPFQAARWRPKAAEDKCLKGRRGPLLIKAGDASGKTGKQKRKWSETMEHAGSKHLMECPARRANKPFQIERSGGRLNGTTWHISPTFIQRACTYRREKKTKHQHQQHQQQHACCFPLFAAAARACFLHLQSIPGIELQLHSRPSKGKSMIFGENAPKKCFSRGRPIWTF